MEAITLDEIKARHRRLSAGSGIVYPTGTADLVALEAHHDRHDLLQAVELYRSIIVNLENEIARLKMHHKEMSARLLLELNKEGG